MKKIVKGDIFIIPNGKVNIEKFFRPAAEKQQFSKATGYKINDDDEMVQVWVTSEGIDNWQCHRGWLEECQLKEEEGFRDLFPGYFPVRVLENLTEGDILECIPQRRFVKPEEIAKLTRYLISEDAKGITGQSINLCAGLSVGI